MLHDYTVLIRHIPAVGLTVLLLTACQPMQTRYPGDNPYATPEQQALSEQVDTYHNTIYQGAALGALIGGGLSGIITAVKGGDSHDIVRNSMIGAAGGAALGAAGGAAVAEQKKQAQQTEQKLDAEISRAKEHHAQLKKIVTTSERLVATREKQYKTLQKAKDAKQEEAFQAVLKADAHTLGQAIEASEKDIANLEAFKSRYTNPAEKKKINRQQAMLRKELRTLKEQQETLVALRKSSAL